MVSSTELRDGTNQNAGGQQTINDLIYRIGTLCSHIGLSYHNNPPIQVSPGIWMFYAVRMDDPCRKYGSCRQYQFYAIDTGSELRLA